MDLICTHIKICVISPNNWRACTPYKISKVAKIKSQIEIITNCNLHREQEEGDRSNTFGHAKDMR